MPEPTQQPFRIACILLGGPEYKIRINGKVMPFEMHPQCGPAVLNRDGDVLDNQPGPRHLFWVAVTQWSRQGRRVSPDGFCVWHPEPTPIAVKRGRSRFLVGQVFQEDRW